MEKGFIELRESETGKKAWAKKLIPKGTILHRFSEPKLPKPTVHSVQLSETVHVEPADGTHFADHQCSKPNCSFIIDSENLEGRFVTLKDIEQGEELSFNYNTTEWHMSAPFTCIRCGSKVAGFKHLVAEERKRLLQELYVSPVIKAKAFQEEMEVLKLLYPAETGNGVHVA